MMIFAGEKWFVLVGIGRAVEGAKYSIKHSVGSLQFCRGQHPSELLTRTHHGAPLLRQILSFSDYTCRKPFLSLLLVSYA
jgi:hypothetical protein